VNSAANERSSAAEHACGEPESHAAAPRFLMLGAARPVKPMRAPVCVCCGWPMGALDVATPGRDGLCLLCETAGCTAAVIGPGVERPEVHRRAVERHVLS
jgi:hypothetical protein